MSRGSAGAALGALLLALLAGGPARAVNPGEQWVVLDTEAGRLVIRLLEQSAPDHCENFKKLVRQGYYDGSPFHRVIEGFMAQGGGQRQPDGAVADVGYTLPPEVDPVLRHVRGSVAAARKGDSVNPQRRSSGSQFYVIFDRAAPLDGQYTIFGHVVDGLDTLDRIRRGDVARDGLVPEAEATLIRHASLEDAEALAAARRAAAPTSDPHPSHAED